MDLRKHTLHGSNGGQDGFAQHLRIRRAVREGGGPGEVPAQTVLLQMAAQRGCCPADIAGMMSRQMPNRPSDLEKLASRAAAAALGSGGPRASAAVPSPIVDAWRALDGNTEAESRFLSEYADLLDSYLEGFEPELAL